MTEVSHRQAEVDRLRLELARAEEALAEARSVRTDYTREELIEICEQGIVSVLRWHDRDSASTQRQLGETWALLKAGCDFKILKDDGGCSTNSQTIWIELSFPGFSTFDVGSGPERETSYLPTLQRLADAEGSDWY